MLYIAVKKGKNTAEEDIFLVNIGDGENIKNGRCEMCLPFLVNQLL